MFQTIHGLTCHPDVTRFEIEDGLVRHCAAELFVEETPITSIIVDVGMHPRPGLPYNESGQPITEYDSSIEFIADTSEVTSPPNLADLLTETAVVGSSSRVTAFDIGELDKSWIGAATPGPKITAYFNASSTSDATTYRDDIVELASMVCHELGDVGCRVSHGEGESPLFNSAISFWFASPKAADDAVESGGFDVLIDSDLIDHSSLAFLEAVEHRIVPNPNTWATTTGVEPPAED